MDRDGKHEMESGEDTKTAKEKMGRRNNYMYIHGNSHMDRRMAS